MQYSTPQRAQNFIQALARLLSAMFCTCVSAIAIAGPVSGELSVSDYYFLRVDGSRGLAQNTVEALHQDSRGFIWIATQAGLHRYDGNALILYQHEPGNPGSLSENMIGTLCETRDSLWVGTLGGHLNRLHLRTGVIERVSLGERPGHAVVNALLCDEDFIHVATSSGLVNLRLNNGDVAAIHDAGEERIDAVARGRSGAIWYSSSHALSVASANEPARVINVGTVNFLSADRAHELLLASSNGLYALDTPEHSQLQRIWPPEGEIGGDVRGLARDVEGRLWLAVRGRGLLRLDADYANSRWIEINTQGASGPRESALRSLLLDSQQRLWLGTDIGGVLHSDSSGSRFQWLHPRPSDAVRSSGFAIRAIAEDEQGQLWLGGDSGGLWMIDAQRQTWTDFAAVWRALLQVADGEITAVNALLYRPPERLLAATTHGLLEIDIKTLAISRWNLPAEFTQFENQVRAMLFDDDEGLWLASFGHGLLLLPSDQTAPLHFHRDAEAPQKLLGNTLLALHEDPQGRLWVASTEGLSRIHQRQAVTIAPQPDDAQGLSGRIVRAIAHDESGTIWIATHSGLNRIDSQGPESDDFRFTRFGRQPGLPGVVLYGLLADGQGGLWISSNQGLIRRDLEDGSFRAFSVDDGLQGLEFNGGAQLRLNSGELAFGGINGVNLFQPERTLHSGGSPRLLLSAWSAGGQRIPIHDGRLPEQIALQAGQDTLSLEFTVLDFVDPHQHRLAWRMNGLNDQWVDAGSSRTVTFSHLAAGNYLFELRAMDDSGRWDLPGLQAMIAVPVPPLRQPMALAGYLVASSLMMVAMTLMLRRRRVRRSAQHRALRLSEDRLHWALWGSSEGLWDWNLVSGEVYRSGMREVLGYDIDQLQSNAQWHRERIHADDLSRVQQQLRQHLDGDSDHYQAEYRIRHAHGHWIWLLDRGKVVERDSSGRPLRMAGTQRDFTRMRQADDERRIAAEVIRSMAEAVTVTDLEFRFTSVNPAFEKTTGYPFRDIAGDNASLLNSPLQDQADYARVRRQLREHGHWRGELWQRRRDGSDMLCWLELGLVRDNNGNASHYVAVLTDITERRRGEQKLRFLAKYDTLTGLPNRVLLGERLTQALTRAGRQDRGVAVLFMDLDHFKHVNDSMGHAAGDALLQHIARRLSAQIREGDTVARLGGDEFTLVMEDVENSDAVVALAERVLQALREPASINGHELVISPSLGIALYPEHGRSADELLKNADTAMYAAKARGRDNYQIYSQQLAEETRDRIGLEASLRRALERDELRLVYQPKLRLRDRRVIGVEALLRWRSEEHGDVAPGRFIGIAEDTGLIVSIGDWVLRQACLQLGQWQRLGLDDLTMAVNVSVMQLLRGDMATRLRDALQLGSVEGTQIEIELTESLLMANADQASELLSELKALGARVAIDDFGTGYSSLAYLKRLPIDTLKVDKAFISDICLDPEDATIVSTIIAMGQAMGLKVVAEGVENLAQMQFLQGRACDEIQGHYFSAPLEADACTQWLKTQRAKEEAKNE